MPRRVSALGVTRVLCRLSGSAVRGWASLAGKDGEPILERQSNEKEKVHAAAERVRQEKEHEWERELDREQQLMATRSDDKHNGYHCPVRTSNNTCIGTVNQCKEVLCVSHPRPNVRSASGSRRHYGC